MKRIKLFFTYICILVFFTSCYTEVIEDTIYANNNLVGIGEQGDGFGVSIANYEAYNMVLDVNHVLDGFSSFDI